MKARLELEKLSDELSLLLSGNQELRKVGGFELNWLADLPKDPWSKKIRLIKAQVMFIEEAVSQALVFTHGETSFCDAEAFAISRKRLENEWSMITSASDWDHSGGWS